MFLLQSFASFAAFCSSRRLGWLALWAAALVDGNGAANAADYPNRTIVVICPWAAGGGTDRMARFVSDQLQRQLGKPVVVQNQTGGSGASGHTAGARARPDGYTITMGTFELSTMRAMGISDLTYRDFQPLMQVNADPAAIIVRNDAPWKSLRDLLADIRARPGRLKMSGTAAGASWDLARAGLLAAADVPIDALVWSPSQGAAPSLVELLGGHIDAVCCSIPEAQSQLEAGQLRVLCVMSPERLPSYPEIPTAKDEGVDWEAVGWRGLFLPKGTPRDVQNLLAARLDAIMRSPAYEEFMAKNGFGIAVRSADEFATFLNEQERRWQPVIEAAGYAAAGARPRVVTSSDPGPWSYPCALAALLVAGCAVVVGRAAWQRLPLGGWRLADWRHRGSLDVALLVLALPLYVAAMPWLGFFVSTQIFSTLMMTRLGVRWWLALPVAAGMLVLVYLLFVWQFRVVLPASPWWSF